VLTQASYSETIHLIYECNTFDTTVSDCTQFLPRFLLTQRLNSIRTIRLDWTIPFQLKMYALQGLENADEQQLHRQKKWKSTWKCLAELKGLCDLRVKLRFDRRRSNHQAIEKSFLDPIKEVTVPRKFELYLPLWMANEGANFEYSNWIDLPCRIEFFSDKIGFFYR
jgi:hypothetical protein